MAFPNNIENKDHSAESLITDSSKLALVQFENKVSDEIADRLYDLATNYAQLIDLSKKQTINLTEDPFLTQQSIPQEVRDKLRERENFKDRLNDEIPADEVIAFTVFLQVNFELEQEKHLMANIAFGQEEIQSLLSSKCNPTGELALSYLSTFDPNSQEYIEAVEDAQLLVNKGKPIESVVINGIVDNIISNENSERVYSGNTALNQSEIEEIHAYFMQKLELPLFTEKQKDQKVNTVDFCISKGVIPSDQYTKEGSSEIDPNIDIDAEEVAKNLNEKVRKGEIDPIQFFEEMSKELSPEQAKAFLKYIQLTDEIGKNEYVLSSLKNTEDFKVAIIAIQNGGEDLQEFLKIYSKGYEGIFKNVTDAIALARKNKEKSEASIAEYKDINTTFKETDNSNTQVSREDILKTNEENIPEVLKNNILDPSKTNIKINKKGDLLISFIDMENVEIFIPDDFDSATNPMKVILDTKTSNPIVEAVSKEELERKVDLYNAKNLAKYYKISGYFTGDEELLEFFTKMSIKMDKETFDGVESDNGMFLAEGAYKPYLNDLFMALFDIAEPQEITKELLEKYNVLEGGKITKETAKKFYAAKIEFDKERENRPTLDEVEEKVE